MPCKEGAGLQPGGPCWLRAQGTGSCMITPCCRALLQPSPTCRCCAYMLRHMQPKESTYQNALKASTCGVHMLCIAVKAPNTSTTTQGRHKIVLDAARRHKRRLQQQLQCKLDYHGLSHAHSGIALYVLTRAPPEYCSCLLLQQINISFKGKPAADARQACEAKPYCAALPYPGLTNCQLKLDVDAYGSAVVKFAQVSLPAACGDSWFGSYGGRMALLGSLNPEISTNGPPCRHPCEATRSPIWSCCWLVVLFGPTADLLCCLVLLLVGVVSAAPAFTSIAPALPLPHLGSMCTINCLMHLTLGVSSRASRVL